jgi:predicted ester cyclase
MSTEQNKAIVRRLYDELINQENKAVIDEVFVGDVGIHDPFMGTMAGIMAFKQLLGMFDAAFPGHRVKVEQVLAEGDFVSVLHTHTATHTGQFMNIPPTGKQVTVNGLELFRLVNGKIVEFWRKDDDVSLLMQLGALPAPQAA